jgi:hypothetical protein
LTIYELFGAGGDDSFYLNPVNLAEQQETINAVVFLALDIHFGMVKCLLSSNENISVSSIISVVGRCNPEQRVVNIVPLFDARTKGEQLPIEFPFIMNVDSLYYKQLFNGDALDCKKYIPFEDWKERY